MVKGLSYRNNFVIIRSKPAQLKNPFVRRVEYGIDALSKMCIGLSGNKNNIVSNVISTTREFIFFATSEKQKEKEQLKKRIVFFQNGNGIGS